MAQGAAITNGGDGAARDTRASFEHALVTLADASPSEVLRWAADRYAPRLAFATGFGPEGLVLFDLIARHRLPVDVFTLDTGLLFPETYALWRRLEEKYGRGIRAVQPGARPRRAGAPPRRAALGARARPLLRHPQGRPARAGALRPRGLDQRDPPRPDARPRAARSVVERDPRFGLVKVNPLARLDERRGLGLPPRATTSRRTRCTQQGYPSIGCWPCTSPVRPGEDPRAGRWRGRAKTECGLHSRPSRPFPIPSSVRKEPEIRHVERPVADPSCRPTAASSSTASCPPRKPTRCGAAPASAARAHARRARAGRPRADRDRRGQPAHRLPGLGRLRERRSSDLRLADGTVWPLPFTLAVPDEARGRVGPGGGGRARRRRRPALGRDRRRPRSSRATRSQEARAGLRHRRPGASRRRVPARAAAHAGRRAGARAAAARGPARSPSTG